jgi:hypothetical protein
MACVVKLLAGPGPDTSMPPRSQRCQPSPLPPYQRRSSKIPIVCRAQCHVNWRVHHFMQTRHRNHPYLRGYFGSPAWFQCRRCLSPLLSCRWRHGLALWPCRHDEMLRCIHIREGALMSNLSSTMLRAGAFHLIPGQDVLNVAAPLLVEFLAFFE